MKLMPLFRVLPYLLFAYSILIVIAEIADLQVSASAAGINSSIITDVRITYLASLVRSFDSMFFYWSMAALVCVAVHFYDAKRAT